MTRRDFDLIASVIRELPDGERIAAAFIPALGTTNDRFDAARFFSAATERTSACAIRT